MSRLIALLEHLPKDDAFPKSVYYAQDLHYMSLEILRANMGETAFNHLMAADPAAVLNATMTLSMIIREAHIEHLSPEGFTNV
jgi:hypothetical protein